MNISEANAFFGLYRAMFSDETTPDDAAEHARFLAERARAALNAGPDASVVAAVFRALAST